MAQDRVDPPMAPPSKKKPASSGKGGINLGPVGAYTPPSKGTPSEKATFDKFILAHPALKNYASDIWNAARIYGGFTATEYAAVLVGESGGNKDAKSSVGALGIAQIYDNAANAMNDAGVPFFRPGNLQISDADKKNPAFAINYMAWRLSGYKTAHGGNIDEAWVKGYNPNYLKTKGAKPNYISQFLPKGYVPTGGATITDTATKSSLTSDVTKSLQDPYITGVNAKGKLMGVTSAAAPKNVVSYDGAPLTQTAFLSLKRQLETYFVTYTGKRPDNATVLKYIQKGWGPYTLTTALSKNPAFFKSPIWKSEAPAYKAAAADLLPPGQSPPQNLMRAAILNKWDTSTFQAVIKKLPTYVESNNFKQTTATLLNVHQSIMGIPDAGANETINQAALAGWQPDQYAAWLRSQPQYTSSPEYQTKTLTFLQSLGLITGAQPVLKQSAVAPVNTAKTDTSVLPTDARLPAAQTLTRPEDTVATLNG